MATVLAAASTLVAASLAMSAPAHAAVLFSDDFEQPTVNVWLANSTWSVVSEDGVPPGTSSFQFGFLATPVNAMQLPTNVTFNGIPCAVALA